MLDKSLNTVKLFYKNFFNDQSLKNLQQVG